MSGHQVAGNTAGDEEGWPRHAPERGEWCTVETRGFEPRPLRATARSSGGHVPLIGRNEVIARNRLLVRAPCPLLRGEYLPTPLGVAGSNEDRLSSPHPTLSPRERSKRIEAPGGASSTTLVETRGFEPPTVGRYAPSSGGLSPPDRSRRQFALPCNFRLRSLPPLPPGGANAPPHPPRGREFKSRQITRNRRTLPRSAILVETAGFEPATPCVQSRCSPAELRPHG